MAWYSEVMPRYTVEYKSNNKVVYWCKYHVIGCPKYRRPMPVPEVASVESILSMPWQANVALRSSNGRLCRTLCIDWWRSIPSAVCISC